MGLGPGAWGPDELMRVVMAPSLNDYKIIVVDASRAYSLVAYGYGERLLLLLYDDHHYDTLTSIKGFLGRSYLCLVCLKGYDHQGQHRCPRNRGEHCSSCLQTDCDEHKAAYRAYRSPDVLCPQCQRHFYGTACLERHRTRTIDGRRHDQDHRPVCQTRRKCPQCRAYLRGSKAIKDHRCGHDTIKTIRYDTTLFNYAGHTQQKLVSRWGVGKHVRISYVCMDVLKINIFIYILHRISAIK